MASNGKQYLVTLLCIIATCYEATSVAPNDESLSAEYDKWMAKYGRYYQSEEERDKRFQIFKDNFEYVESFNSEGTHAYKLGINGFADLTKDEFLAKYAGSFTPSPQGSPGSSFRYENMKAVPSSLDWRERKAVTPIGTQGECERVSIWSPTINCLTSPRADMASKITKKGDIACHISRCCWAFSAVAAIEGVAAIKSGKLTSLSEQHIIDCNIGREGCKGGRMEHAFDFVKQNRGLASDANYPYQSQQGACSVNKPSSLAVKITGYERIPSNNETALLLAVANQPVSLALDPSLFQFYESGILTGECGNKLSHAVTAVGYGASEVGTKFWILKNSWGPEWGEQGYVRIQRDVNAKEGMCGLAMDLTYPTA